jgi:hypothetical protein
MASSIGDAGVDSAGAERACAHDLKSKKWKK